MFKSERSRIDRTFLFLPVLVVAAGLAGCGETQVAPVNRRLVESLATAVSAKNPEWLRENVEAIAKAKAEGTLTAAEEAAFRTIIEPAEKGDWAEAERLAFSLRDGQRAASEDRASSSTPKIRPPSRPLSKSGVSDATRRVGSRPGVT